MTNTELEPCEAPQKKSNFKAIVFKIGKRNFIIAGAVLLIGAAVVLNWVLFDGSDIDGKQVSGTGSDTQTEQKTDSEPDEKQTYFSATQVSRQKARDEALEVLQSVVEDTDATETMKTEALTSISAIATEIEKEANIESLITAKGFENCVAVLNGNSASIIVSAETLQPADLAQINTIVYEQTGILPANITIINK